MRFTWLDESGFRTSVSVLRRPAGGMRWVLLPTIHMGHADYYWAIWQRLRSCHAVIAEIFDGISPTGLLFANAMRLARQKASRDLVPQDIDYGALGVPIIFPDGHLAGEPQIDRQMSFEQQVSVTMWTPVLALQMALSGRDDWVFSEEADVTDDMRFDDLAVRDALVIAAIREIDGAFAAEPDMEVGIVFGAAHMPAVARELCGRLGYREEPGTSWLTAVDFDEPAHMRRPPLDGWMDW